MNLKEKVQRYRLANQLLQKNAAEEISRRDARIKSLESDLAATKKTLDKHFKDRMAK